MNSRPDPLFSQQLPASAFAAAGFSINAQANNNSAHSNITNTNNNPTTSGASSSSSSLPDEHFRECFKLMNEFRYLQNTYPPSPSSTATGGGFLCDVEIRVDERTFPCHRVLLAAAIPYFRSMFSSDMLETKQRQIEIQDISARAFEQLLNYVYTGAISITIDTAQPLLFAASILQMDRVCTACEEFLTSYLTIQNCLAIRSFAQAHNRQQLLRDVDVFAMDHFGELRTRDEFMRIGDDHLMDLLTSSDVNVTSETDVYETVMAWVAYSSEARTRYLPALLSKVRLCQLPAQYLMENVRSNPLVKDSESCRDLISETLAKQLLAAGVFSYSQRAGATAAVTSLDSEQSRPRKSVAGVIFCIGGRGTNGDPFRSVEAYDCRRNRWISVAEMNTKRRHVGVVSAFGKLYAIGGHDGVEHLGSVEVYNPESNAWTSVASMSTRRRGIAVGRLEGAIYAVGGLDDGACFNIVERYDIEANRWQDVAHTNVQRGGVGVAALGKYLFAVGGNDGTASLDSCERYDPLLNKWTIVSSMAHRRAGAGVAVLNGCLYAIGGFDDNAPLATCERYNPQDNTWTPLPPMSCPRGGVGVAALGGRLYAVGGHDGYHYLNSVEAYDPYKNTWEPVATITQCRAGAGVAWCDCSMDSIQSVPNLMTVASCV